MESIHDPVTNAQILHELGRISGQVAAAHEAQTQRMSDLRAEIQRMDRSHSERADRMEASINKRIEAMEAGMNKRIDGVGARVTALEQEDKKIIAQTARLGAIGGGIGGTMAAAAVELLKHFSK